jgi:hypothetical protein
MKDHSAIDGYGVLNEPATLTIQRLLGRLETLKSGL